MSYFHPFRVRISFFTSDYARMAFYPVTKALFFCGWIPPIGVFYVKEVFGFFFWTARFFGYLTKSRCPEKENHFDLDTFLFFFLDNL